MANRLGSWITSQLTRVTTNSAVPYPTSRLPLSDQEAMTKTNYILTPYIHQPWTPLNSPLWGGYASMDSAGGVLTPISGLLDLAVTSTQVIDASGVGYPTTPDQLDASVIANSGILEPGGGHYEVP